MHQCFITASSYLDSMKEVEFDLNLNLIDKCQFVHTVAVIILLFVKRTMKNMKKCPFAKSND